MLAGEHLVDKVAGASNHGRKGDEATVWRVENLAGLELLRAGFVTHSFVPHSHDVFMIAVYQGGEGEVAFHGSRHIVGPGSLLLLNPGDVYSGRPRDGTTWRYRAFYPDEQLIRRIATELDGRERIRPAFRPGVTDDAPLVAPLRRLHAALEEPLSSLESETRLLDVLGQLLLRHADDGPELRSVGREHRAVHKARAYLEAHVSENTTLEALAREVGVGSYHLVRVFRRDVGLPPHAYQAQLRVRLAKRLLLDGMTPAQVAVEAGFYDQSHLTKRFKRYLGVTPARYAPDRGRRQGGPEATSARPGPR